MARSDRSRPSVLKGVGTTPPDGSHASTLQGALPTAQLARHDSTMPSNNDTAATKTCKQCEQALPLTAFGTKQSRCKKCIADLRAGKATLKVHPLADPAGPVKQNEETARVLSMVTADVAMETAMDDECPAPKAKAKRSAKPATDKPIPMSKLSPEERLARVIARSEADPKVCDEHGPIVGDLLSIAYARRGNTSCRECVNAYSKAKKRESARAKKESTTDD